MLFPKRILGAISLSIVALGLMWAAGLNSLRADLTVRQAARQDSSSLPAQIIQEPWTHFAANAAATQYASLSQITPENVSDLELAWVYRTGELQRRDPDQVTQSDFANTPIIAGGSLIVCTPWNRVIALDPATGRERWVFDPGVTIRMEANKYVCRGVAAWRDSQSPADAACAERLIMGTLDLRIFAIDARDGKPCMEFGNGGQVRIEHPDGPAPQPGVIKFNAPPMIVNGVAIFGSSIYDGYRSDRPRGTVRAFDARTGALRWTFEPIPTDLVDPAWPSRKDHNGREFGGGNVWADMAADEARDLVFLPTSSPSMDFYGGFRPGENRHANSVVALRASTGQMVWSYQIVHHDIWDYDLPAAPLLIDLSVAGKTVPAVVQITKQGLIFVLHRETGAPIFPIEERPFPVSDLPGEWTSPTQPIPSTMPAVMPLGLKPEDAWGITFWDRAACRREIGRYHADGLYAPMTVQGTVCFPNFVGGPNLGMRAYDPKRRLFIVNTSRSANAIAVAPNKQPNDKANGPYSHGFTQTLLSPLGAPCNAPPWGMLTAIDLEGQRIAWEVPLGTIEKLTPIPIPLLWGTPNRGGPMLTESGLTFIAATMDDKFRAFETQTGRELWTRRLPAGGQATPMTYMVDGRQYVVIAAGGHSRLGTTLGDYVLGFALPR